MARPFKNESKLELNALQRKFIDTYFDCNESPARTARAMNWPDRGRVSSMLKSEKVAIEIARRKGQMDLFMHNNDTFNISREERIKLLWSIAQAGAERVYDRQGNMIMMNPVASISAIREINLMMGDNPSTQIEVIAEPDRRSESEIRQNVRRLITEFNKVATLSLQSDGG